MTSLMHADIFFFITTVAVVIGTIIVCIVAWYVIKILQDVHYITGKLRDATDGVESGFDSIHSFISRFIPGRRKKQVGSSSKIKVDEDTV